jgi:hypothetical protein
MMTDEGRAAVSEAQKKRWRKFRKGRKAAKVTKYDPMKLIGSRRDLQERMFAHAVGNAVLQAIKLLR